MKNTIFLIAALIALCSASCTSSVKVTQRPDTWQAGNGRGAIYDIVVSNPGTCGLTNIRLSITLPSGATINNYWNLQVAGSYWDVTSYEGLLPPGASVNAGMSVNFPGQPTGITVTVFSTTCPPSCSPSTPAPTSTPPSTPSPTSTPPSTPSPTSTPPSTPSPTSTPPSTPSPSPSPSSSPSSCNIAAALRLGSAWTTNGVRYGSYALFLTNNGNCPMTNYVASFTLNGGEIYQTWNLQSATGGYTVQGYGSELHSGDTYGGSGFNIRLSGAISVTTYSVSCSC